MAERAFIPPVMHQGLPNQLGARVHQSREIVRSREELSLGAESLAREVTRVRQEEANRKEQGEPWYYLRGTGFFVHGQIRLFLEDIQKERAEGKPLTDAIHVASVKIEQDINGFEDEYLKQLAGLKWNIGWKEVGGVKKLYGLDYNGAILEALTGKDEREGALFDAWFTDKPQEGKIGIESWLRTAPKGSKVLLVSPSGWSGYEGFTYPQTQIYYVEIGEGETIKSFTLRYDAPIEKNEELQKALGVMVPEVRNERDRIKQMLGSPIFISPDGSPEKGNSQQRINSPEDVISLMQKIQGKEVAFADEKFGNRTFADMRAFVRNPELFLARHQESHVFIDSLKEYIAWEFGQKQSQSELRQKLEIALALVIVQLKGLYFGHASSSSTNMRYERRTVPSNLRMQKDMPAGIFQSGIGNYKTEAEEIQKLPGCASSGSSKVRKNSMGSSREMVDMSNSSENYSFNEVGTCVVCNKGPQSVGPCKICQSCDADLGGKAATMYE